ncbi:hypothetical protein [Acaryochloris sp. 'Moss Beach']|uniref:hypothetical protein n=1 Tax=Acaryochloris sp. 'Moss Beach' TaxID=2740837 RepID=UPI001F3E6404|nr:hypothetical protein [Acaryochloris sp. 'Moss Beach']
MTTPLFILLATLLSIGYGFGVQGQALPFTTEMDFSAIQLQFLRGWLILAWITGILLPIILLIQARKQAQSRAFWGVYLAVLFIQIFSEGFLRRWLVPSVVVPIGFFYSAFRLWQLFDAFGRLTLTRFTKLAFRIVALFWAANLVMLSVLSFPTIFKGF